MPTELPETFFVVLDEDEALVSADLASRWSPEVALTLEQQGVLERTVDADQVPCDACDDQHSVKVIRLENGLFGACPSEGRIEIDPARLKQWRVNPDGLASRMAEAFGGRVRAVLPGRLWRIESVSVGGQRRRLFVARGLRGEGGEAILRRTFSEGGRIPAVVLAALPPFEPLHERGAPVVFALSEMIGVHTGSLVVREQAFEELVPERTPRTVRHLAAPRGASWSDVTMVVSAERLRVEIWAKSVLVADDTLTYDEAGFIDRRGRKPNDLWWLLRELAAPSREVPLTVSSKQKPRVSRLRLALKSLIPIKGDPIAYKDKIYRAAFLIRGEGAVAPLDLPRGTRWPDVSLWLEDRNRVRLAAKDRTIVLDMEQLGLSDKDGLATRAGTALRGFVGGTGVVKDTTDFGMLELNKAFRDLGIPGEPFLATPVKGDDFQIRWAAAFALTDERHR